MSGSGPEASAPAYVRTANLPFLSSLPVDRPLARVDLAGSIAHVEMLGASGLLTAQETAQLVRGLRAVAREVADGSFPWRPELEDVHTNVEVRLTELVGPVGGKLHTARSRNDQIAVDERLFLRAAIGASADRLAALARTLLERAAETVEVPMPGYTHLQRAQTVSVAHWLLAHFWRLDRDLDRLLATAHRADVSPLGAGALAGSTLPIDPAASARRLGFERVFENSMDAVSDRDAIAELLFDLALVAVHASSLGEEIVLYASSEFGFLERTEALGAGSSLMPQKRNPDLAELARGKTGRVVGDLVALLTVLKGLPLTYNRDLQEDKAPLLDAVETVGSVVEVLSALLGSVRFDMSKLRAAAADPGLLATDRAERLVAAGAPFREAHERIAREYASVGSATAAGEPSQALAARATPGAPAPDRVVEQLARARASLAARRASLSSLERKVERIEELLNEAKP
ncbi:MAG TPA: argininosuccinate lyase [Thermoplasmata archaeon]|nr:argininosuccinate lyase [Thermoplasmata archaeon]